ncbi:MAG: NUDIX hydrolase [Ignavibacteriales bacterium]|nr:NUDIX hydrolase [Ignavibacteriaceae bacterium]QOJ29331.1 MAG: NUDIX hydrolase [Ignavibacteriales bacterium]
MRPSFKLYQSGLLAYKKENGQIHFLLITSRKSKKWIIPKGYIDSALTPFESAQKEAYEEAGIICKNSEKMIGEWWIQKKYGKNVVVVYCAEIVKELEQYPEKNERIKKWFSSDEAIKETAGSELSVILKKALTFIG